MSEEQTTVEEQVTAAEEEAKAKRTREKVTVNPVAHEGDLPADETSRGGADTSQWDAALAQMAATPGVWFHLTSYAKRSSATGRAKDMGAAHAEKGYEFAARTVKVEGNPDHRLYGRKVA